VSSLTIDRDQHAFLSHKQVAREFEKLLLKWQRLSTNDARFSGGQVGLTD
jgi:hypothetical protein